MSRFSVTNIAVGDMLQQRRTGEVFKVTEVQGTGRVTIISATDPEQAPKVLTLTIIGRWYLPYEQTVQEQGINELSQTSDSTQCAETDTSDAVQPIEQEEVEQPTYITDPTEQEDVTPPTYIGVLTEQEDVEPPTYIGVLTEQEETVSDECVTESSEEDAESDTNNASAIPDSVETSINGESVPECPVQPAIPERAARQGRGNAKEVDPVIAQIRERICAYSKGLSQSVTVIEKVGYTALRDTHNFTEINRSKTRITINVKQAALTAEQLNMCKVYPKSYGWSLNAGFTIVDEQDVEQAKELIKASWLYITTTKGGNGNVDNQN